MIQYDEYMEKQINQPVICEQTKENMWNRISRERAEKKARFSENLQAISPKLTEVYSKDQLMRKSS